MTGDGVIDKDAGAGGVAGALGWAMIARLLHVPGDRQ